MKINSLVKIKNDSWNNKYINISFRKWLIEHKNKIFKIEKIVQNAIKLYKVDFWITKEYLNDL